MSSHAAGLLSSHKLLQGLPSAGAAVVAAAECTCRPHALVAPRVPDRAGGAQLRLYPFPRAPVDIAPLFDRLVIFPSTTMLHRLRARPDSALCMHASRCNAVRLALLCTACSGCPGLLLLPNVKRNKILCPCMCQVALTAVLLCAEVTPVALPMSKPDSS